MKSKIKKGIIDLYTDIAKNGNKFQYGGDLYKKQKGNIDEELLKYSFGCGTPLEYTNLKSGDRVLDIGCGAGLDLILAYDKVGKDGELCGVELTKALVDKAFEQAKAQNIENINVKNSSAEEIDFEDNYFDTVISNAVIHLVEEKTQTFNEINRVLKNDGEVIISDIVHTGKMPKELKNEFKKSKGKFLYGGIINESNYFKHIFNAGFEIGEVLNRVRFKPEEEAIKTFKKGFKRNDPMLKNKSFFDKLKKELENINFFVITYKLKKKSELETVRSLCTCGNEITMKTLPSINVTDFPLQKHLLFNYKINSVVCENCSKINRLNTPYMYHDMEKKIFGQVLPLELKGNPICKSIEDDFDKQVRSGFQNSNYRVHSFYDIKDLKEYIEKYT